ncbi:hypothetical protein JCM6882_004138, partial [Rhodosporidiobolus microsporus]
PPQCLYRKVAATDILAAYEALAPPLDPRTPLRTPTTIDEEAKELTRLLHAVVDRAVPLSKPRRGSHAAPWWTAEVAEASATARRARNIAVRQRGREDENETAMRARVTTVQLRALVRREKARAEREDLEGVTSENLWTKVKRRLGGGTDAASATPPLRRSDGTYAVSTNNKLSLLLPEVTTAAAADGAPANAAAAPPPTPPTPRTLGVCVASTKASGGGKDDAARKEDEGGDGKGGGGIESGGGRRRPAGDGQPKVSPLYSCISPLSRRKDSLATPRGGKPADDALPADTPARRLNPDAPPFVPSPPPRRRAAALFATRPFAAAGPDEVSNQVLRLCWPSLRHHLVPLLAASLRLGHVPPGWKEGTATVLKKPKKPDYASPKAYRLIVFGQSTAKLLKAVVARRIAYLGEENEEVLPKSHYGGRRCRSAEDAVVAVDNEVRRQWRAGRVIVVMVVDLAKAFPSVLEEKVAEALREAGFGEELVGWVRDWMRDRTVRVWFEGVMSGRIDWRSGLPQGSPLSPMLFLVFISALLRRTTTATTKLFGWVYDVNVLAWGKTVEEAASNLQAVVPEMASWARQRGATFEPEKTMLTLFAPPNKILPHPLPTVTLNNTPLPYSPSLTMLGVKFDSSLSYRAHRAACAAKASTALAGVALLARSKAGLPPRRVKELVEALVMPRLLWCCAVWWKPGSEVSKVVEAVQREAARVVTGGFRTTSLAALEVESNLLPLPLQLDHHLFRLALRLHSSTPSHPLHERFRLARPAPAHPHQSAINCAVHSFPALLPPSTSVEPIHPDPVAPWARPPPVAIAMAESKEAGQAAHRAMEEALRGAEALPLTSIVTLLDNSAVVSHPFDPSPTPGQHLRLLIRDAFLALHRTFPAAALVVKWVPGHVGVEGNKQADDLANAASDEAKAEEDALVKRAAPQARRRRGGGFFRREMMYEEEGEETAGDRTVDSNYSNEQHLSTPARVALDTCQHPNLRLLPQPAPS